MNNLPNNIEAEKIVINALLQKKEVKDIYYFLDDNYYLDELHKTIITGIKQLYEENLSFEIGLIDEKISSAPVYLNKKGKEYLLWLKEQDFSIAQYKPYFDILINKYILRERLKSHSKAQLAILEGKPEGQKILEECERDIYELSKLKPEIKKLTKASVLIDSILEKSFIRGLQPGTMLGIPSGFHKLDEMTLGFQKTDMSIIAARSSSGKSSVVTSIIANHLVSLSNYTTAVFSLEMSEEQIVQRIISAISHVELWRIRTGKLDVSEWARVIFAQRLIKDSNIFIDDTPGVNSNHLRTKIKTLKKESSLDIAFIDYIQLMSSGKKADTRALEVSQITRDIKVLAKEEEIPLIGLSQLSRAVDKRTDSKEPQLSDLKESSSLEQDPDAVYFIYRDNLYNPKPENEALAKIIIAKQRNGPTGSVYLSFFGKFTKFENLDYEKIEN